MTDTRRSVAITGITVTIATTALAVSPVAAATGSDCLALNGAQRTANSHTEATALGILFTDDTTLDYWYQNGAVNWHRTTDSTGTINRHSENTGTIPASPGSTVSIAGPASISYNDDSTPLLFSVTVCSK